MKFYLGTHEPAWLGRTDVPLFVSHRRLARRKAMPRAIGSWALDSGGFTELLRLRLQRQHERMGEVMGYYTSISGEITVTPPVPWSKLKDSKRTVLNEEGGRSGWPDNWVAISVDAREVDTDEGTLIRKEGSAIVVYPDSGKFYSIENDVQAIVDEIGGGHTFSGYLEGEGEESGDMWRLYVVNRKVVRIVPEIVWPPAPT